MIADILLEELGTKIRINRKVSGRYFRAYIYSKK